MATQRSADGATLTPERLQAIFKDALRGRAAVPSIEVCRGLIPMLAGLRKHGPNWAGGEQLSNKARKASITLRRALPKVEDYWRGIYARPSPADPAVIAREAGRVARKLATLRAAMDDCADVLGPVPMMPYRQRWDEFAVLVLQVFDEGMAGIDHDDFGLWIDAPRVVFLHRVVVALGWTGTTLDAVLKYLLRNKSKDKPA